MGLVDFSMLIAGQRRDWKTAELTTARSDVRSCSPSTSIASYHVCKYLTVQISVCENKHTGYCSTVAFRQKHFLERTRKFLE